MSASDANMPATEGVDASEGDAVSSDDAARVPVCITLVSGRVLLDEEFATTDKIFSVRHLANTRFKEENAVTLQIGSRVQAVPGPDQSCEESAFGTVVRSGTQDGEDRWYVRWDRHGDETAIDGATWEAAVKVTAHACKVFDSAEDSVVCARCGKFRFEHSLRSEVHVCALVRGGAKLEDAATVEECGLGPGSAVTAVVSEVDELQDIELAFHSLIMQRNGCVGDRAKLEERGFVFPSLKEHLHKTGTGSSKFYAVPGMYGGFKATLLYDWTVQPGSQFKLVCTSFIRICGGSGQTHEITHSGGTVMTESGFC